MVSLRELWSTRTKILIAKCLLEVLVHQILHSHVAKHYSSSHGYSQEIRYSQTMSNVDSSIYNVTGEGVCYAVDIVGNCLLKGKKALSIGDEAIVYLFKIIWFYICSSADSR